uniref:Large ribosomal subunit protein mL49 n=1 Tax=Chrysotila carterae TaxID=13221 RepID=A0A7S4BVZ3_CHRCT|mmetsp:Transcript_49236/g.106635  ORF Transcript_49236/g.106635 Transcript_49236/m.106635 type:complete len:183 (+) Transcript_49236:242-790(+)
MKVLMPVIRRFQGMVPRAHTVLRPALPQALQLHQPRFVHVLPLEWPSAVTRPVEEKVEAEPKVLTPEEQEEEKQKKRLQRLPPFLRHRERERAMEKDLDQIPAGPKPFSVARSSKGNYPVYSEMRNNNRRSTVLRKYSGDVKALIKELEAVTGRTVIQRNGCLDVLGNHNAIITKWLYKCGF